MADVAGTAFGGPSLPHETEVHLSMFTEEELRRARRRLYVEWYRCEETGRKLGVWFRAWQLQAVVTLHRPTPLHREWVGVAVWWGRRTVVNTFPKFGKRAN
jgi:hypothetical protein